MLMLCGALYVSIGVGKIAIRIFRGDYASFKIMHAQKQKEYAKAYDRQQKAIKQLKASGKSAKAAEKAAAGKGKGKAKAKGKGTCTACISRTVG